METKSEMTKNFYITSSLQNDTHTKYSFLFRCLWVLY